MNIEKIMQGKVIMSLGIYLKYTVLVFAAVMLTAYIAGIGIYQAISALTLEHFSDIPHHEVFTGNVSSVLNSGVFTVAVAAVFLSLLISFKITSAVVKLKKLKQPKAPSSSGA